MANRYTTSVNILRDTERELNYIPTPNGKQVVAQMVNDFKKGIHSFNIIGTYGSGKSSFLLALEHSLKGTKRYFEPNFTSVDAHIDFVKIVGSYTSIVEYFANKFEVTSSKNKHEEILWEIYNRYNSLGKPNRILFLLLDEFGKFLEYASKHNPENELFFIQQLAEFCNDPKHSIILITTIHQSFESYAYGLSPTQKQEWNKVKGRFREITFNEPVEQLLFLAAEFLGVPNENISINPQIEKCLELAISTRSLSFNKDFMAEITAKLWPLDMLSANVLTLSLQRYGQNERSLFSFLESTDHTGIMKFNRQENPFYNLGCVYDYLNFNFYSYLTSKYNPDFSAWSTIRSSLEKAERAFDASITDYSKAIKTIGLLNIFSPGGAILDKNFLAQYLEISGGVSDSANILEKLDSKRIIHFRSHSRRYILFEGTDLDIQTALIEAGNKISEVSDITTLLNLYFQFTPVFAKLNSYKTGTPRFFEYIISEFPITSRIPLGEIDGYINLVFNSKLEYEDVKSVSKKQKESIIYCFFTNSSEIKNLLFEIEKIKRVIEENENDKVAKRELENIVDAQVRLLNHYITDSMYSTNKDVKWVFQGEEQVINNKKDFNKLLSHVCDVVYDSTPVFKNELVNKHRISSSIHSAKRNYFKALVNNWNKDNLGFDEFRFPPEKTIYLTLIKENGISPSGEFISEKALGRKHPNISKLWEASEKFLTSAKSEQKSIGQFVDILSKRPFKLKQGLIDFWIPTFLFLRRADFALFNRNGYLPILSDENLELIAKYPATFYIKTFDIEGVKLDIFNSYRTFLNQSTDIKVTNDSFIETIKPFIVFYKQLPNYSRVTKRLSETALKVRHAIATSRDPEETFFVAFPNALGISLNTLRSDHSKLESYTSSLQNAVRELRTSFNDLINRFEEFICIEFIGSIVDFNEYKLKLQVRYTKLKKHLLLPGQKVFIQRIDSGLEDKKAWLSSVAQAVTGKILENFTDEDELLLYEKFKAMILELDSLTIISKAEFDETNEEVIGVKIDTFLTQIDPKIVRMPKKKTEQIEFLKNKLKRNLSSDKSSNIAAVLNLLKELLQ